MLQTQMIVDTVDFVHSRLNASKDIKEKMASSKVAMRQKRSQWLAGVSMYPEQYAKIRGVGRHSFRDPSNFRHQPGCPRN